MNKVFQEATPHPHPPKLLLQIWRSHKSDENDPKNAEIRLSEEQSHPCLIFLCTTIHVKDKFHNLEQDVLHCKRVQEYSGTRERREFWYNLINRL